MMIELTFKMAAARHHVSFLWPPYEIGQAIILSSCGFFFFFLLSFFFSSPNLSRRRSDVYHTSTLWCGLSANLGRRSETCCTRLDEIQDARNRHLGTIAQLCGVISSQRRHVLKNMLNSNIFSTCPRNMTNFGPLTAEIGLPVWGTPANFNRFRVLAALLHGTLAVSVSQTLRR